MREVKPLSLAWGLSLTSLICPALFLAKDLPLEGLAVLLAGVAYLLLGELRGSFRPLSLKAQLLLIVPFLLWTILTLRSETLIVDFMGLLLVIATAKVLGDRTPRDILQIFLLAQLLLVGAAVVRLDLLYAFLFVLESGLVILGLIFLYAAKECEHIPQNLALKLTSLAGAMTLGVLTLTVFYFVFLPRPQFTLFAVPFGAARTGLSERVAPGEVSVLKEDPSVAFRVRWLSGPRPKRPYFRVYVYDRYRNGVWEALKGNRIPREIAPGPQATLEVLPEVEIRALPVPGYALTVKTLKGPRARPGPEGTVFLETEVLEPAIWRLKVRVGKGFPVERSPEEFLDVPRSLRPSLETLARKLKKEDPLETARAVARYLRENYVYTLKPGSPEGEPIRWFLFEARRGHCEYFATAMVFILRALGIPARVVGGYAGGEWNPLGKYYLLRERDAHTWVEAFIPERGWVTFDPTSAADLARRGKQGFGRLQLLWDYLQFKWYYWVIEYDFLKQMRILRGIGNRAKALSRPSLPRFSARNLFWGLAGLFLGVILWGLILRARRKSEQPVEKLLALLERAGYPRSPAETLQEYFERVSRSRPELSSILEEFLELYYREAFGDEKTRERQGLILRRLYQILDKNGS